MFHKKDQRLDFHALFNEIGLTPNEINSLLMSMDDDHDLIDVLSYYPILTTCFLIKIGFHEFIESALYYLARFHRVILFVTWILLWIFSLTLSEAIDFFRYIAIFALIVSLFIFVFSLMKAMLDLPIRTASWLLYSNGTSADFCNIDAKYLSETLYVSYLVKNGLQTDSQIERSVFRIKLVRDLEPSNFDGYFKTALVKLGFDQTACANFVV